MIQYAFDEGAGTTAAEVDGGAAIAGVPGWGAGRHGSAMAVNGTSGPTINPFTVDTAFTIMLDVFIAGDGVGGVTMILSGSSLGNLQVLNASGIVEWYLGPYPTSQAIAQGEWVNLAITADGTNRRVFINGALASGGTSASASRSGTDPIYIGGYFAGGYVPNIRVDNLRIYDTALSNAEIAALAGTPVTEIEPPPPENVAPTANAGPNASAFVGQQVTLIGSGTDTDGTIASYAWTQVSGPTVALAGSGTTRTFTPSVAGSYIFALVVTDDDGAQSTPDAVTITVSAIPEDPDPVSGNGADRLNDALIRFTGCIGSAFDDICTYGLTVGDTYVPFDPDEDEAENEDCDEYGCSQVWVRVENINAITPDSWDNGCAVRFRIELEVGVIRCFDIPEEGEAPTATQVLVSATQAMKDMNTIFCAAMGCDTVDDEFDSIVAGTWLPLGPIGGQYGGTWSFTVETA